MNQTIIQGIGFIALLFVILSFQHNKRGLLLLYLTLAQTLFTVHFSLLHAWTGAVMNGTAVPRTFIFNKKGNNAWARYPAWPYIFMVIFALMGLLTWKNIFSLLPIIAMAAETFAIWHDDTKSIRTLVLIPRPLWFIYNVSVGSYAGIVTELFVLTSILVAIVRFDILKKK